MDAGGCSPIDQVCGINLQHLLLREEMVEPSLIAIPE